MPETGRHIYVDAADTGGSTVRILGGLRGDTTRHLHDRGEARRYAHGKLGRQGCIVDTTDMTPEQLAAHRAREARIAGLAATPKQQEEDKQE